MKPFLLIFYYQVIIVNIFFLLYDTNNEDSLRLDSAKNFYHNKITEVVDDSLTIAKLQYEYAQFLDDEGQYEIASELFKQALETVISLDNDSAIAKIANYLGNEYAMLGNFTLSNEAYIRALESAQKNGDAGEIAKISMNLASNYNFTGDYDKAITYGLYALKTKETANNLTRICYHYVAVGNIFKETNNIDKWNEYTMKAYKMKDIEGCSNIGDIAKIYNSLGGIAEQRNELDKALAYYDTLQIISTEAGFYQGISTALTNSADIYKQKGDYPKALSMALEAEQYFDGNPYERIFNNNFKAELYQEMNKPEKGLELAKENFGISEIEYYSTEKLKCLELLYSLNAALSNFPEALAWGDSARAFESKLRNEEIIKSLEELETKYQTEKKEQQIELLTAENEIKNQRIQLGIILLVVLILVVLLILYIYRVRRKEAELIQNDLQQQVLRSQMNPHFIFNVLGSIQNFMLANDTSNAARYLSRFASLTRSTLEYSSEEKITLTKEIEMLKNYIELEQMRMPGKFTYEIAADENLESDFIEIPPMMIQPFVENSIKHGFKTLDRPGELLLKITEGNDFIEFRLEDNGKGITEKKESDNSHRSMAMLIFEKRRKLIQKKYNKDVFFQLTNLNQSSNQKTGVKITIKLPVL